MKQNKTISDLKDAAKEQLTGKFSGAILAGMVPGLFTMSLTLAVSTFVTTITAFSTLGIQSSAAADTLTTASGIGQSVIVYLLLQVLSIFTGVFNTGLALYFLNIACGRTALIANLFYGFHYMFKKSFIISAVMTLINTVCLLPYNIFLILYQADGSTRWLLYTVVSLVAGMIIYLPISLGLSQSYYLLLDFPGYNVGALMRFSFRIMKGRKWKLFLLEASFIPLLLLGMLSLGIGDLWITPYLNMTMALFFLDIMKAPSESGQ